MTTCARRSSRLHLLLARELEAKGDDLAGGTLTPLVCRYIRGRVQRGEITTTTASGLWSALDTLSEAHGARPVKQLSRDTLLRWRTLRAHLKPSTQCSQWSMVAGFCAWLVDEGYVRTDPTRGMKAPRRPRSVPRALEVDDIAALLEVVPDTRARAIVWLMVGMGLRCIEVHRLNIEDWQRNDRVMRVVGKGSHERIVAVPVAAARPLDAYLIEWPATSGPFIRTYRASAQALKPGTLSHWISDWMRLAGVKRASRDGVSAHALRHTCASDVLEESGDLRTVMEMLGHQHLSSTSVYLRRAGIPKMREAMEGRTYRRTVVPLARSGGDDVA